MAEHLEEPCIWIIHRRNKLEAHMMGGFAMIKEDEPIRYVRTHSFSGYCSLCRKFVGRNEGVDG